MSDQSDTQNTKIGIEQGGDRLFVKSGGELDIESGGALKIDGVAVGASAAELNEYSLTLDIADGSAEGVYYLVCPHAGTIKKIYSVIDGAVSTADITITAAIAATPVTNGVVTIATAASGAGDVDVASPTAANVVTAGQAINLTVTGGGAGGSPRIHVAVVIER